MKTSVAVILWVSLLSLLGCKECGPKARKGRLHTKPSSNRRYIAVDSTNKGGGPDPSTLLQKDQQGRTKLHNMLAYASEQNSLDIIKSILASLPILTILTVTDNLGRSLLHEAVYGGNLEIVRAVLDELKKKHPQELQTMVNQAESSLNKTPWVYAVKNRSIDLARLLVQYGANPTEPELIDALLFSIKDGKLALLQYLLDEVIKNQSTPSINGGNLCHIAATADWDDIVEYLVDTKHINIQASDDLGMTPLHYAALYNNRRTLIELLKKGASVDARQKEGKTALHLAVEKVHRDAVFSLLSYGAAVYIQDNSGKTALDLAQQQSIKDTSLDLKLIKKKLSNKLRDLSKQKMDEID